MIIMIITTKQAISALSYQYADYPDFEIIKI